LNGRDDYRSQRTFSMSMIASLADDRSRRSTRTIAANAIIALAGLSMELYAFWPGLMSSDSIVQYTQALLRHYNDQHPPVMAWLWSWTERVISGPGGMLTVHLCLLWTGLWMIAEGARRRGLPYTWLVPLAGLLPTIANIAGVIWKDVGMAYALLCAGALLYVSSYCTRKVGIAAVVSALVLIGYATMIRANAAAATFGIACYWIATVLPRARTSRTLVGGALAVVLLLSVQQIIERKALDASPRHLSQLVMLFDLAAIACGGADVDIPEDFRAPGFDRGTLCRAYDPDQVDKLVFVPGSPLVLSYDETPYVTLRKTWLATVRAHPALYVRHHAVAFAGLLGLRDVSKNDRYLRQEAMHDNPWGITFTPNRLSRTFDAIVDALADVGVFNGALWLGVAAVLLAVIARTRAPLAFEFALLASAVMYLLPYFFLSLAPNYRFIYWSVLATSVAAVLMALRAAGSSREARVAASLEQAAPGERERDVIRDRGVRKQHGDVQQDRVG